MTQPVPLWKRTVFRLFPTFLIVCLLLATELSLRLFVPSLDVPLVTVEHYDGTDWYRINRRFLDRYFPADVVLLPELKPTLFRKTKSPHGFRVVCLGESSMFGTPYQMNATIPAILRIQLRRLMPERDVEVINLGASAINSNVIADLAPRVLAFSPDVVLLYAGHNEFYGPDGVGASWLERRLPWLTPWKYALRDVRIVRLFSQWIGGAAEKRATAADRNMMRQVSRGALVPEGSEDAERVYRSFERNLESIINVFRRARIPLIVSDVTSNLLFAPFAPELPSALAHAEAALNSENAHTLLQSLDEEATGDSASAALEYLRGRDLLALGDAEAARMSLRRARDLDLLKFRATGRTNEIIHRVCEWNGIPCVPADSLIASLSPHGIAGGDLFWEHLHLTAKGYYQIAGIMLSAIEHFHYLPPELDRQDGNAPRIPYDADSLAIPWLDLAYADISMRQLTSHWPFQNVRVPAVVMAQASEELRNIALDVYTLKISWDEGCYRSALEFLKAGRSGLAAVTYRGLIEDSPLNGQAHYLLANVLKESGALQRAADEYAQAVRLMPGHPYSRVELGLVLTNLGEFDQAIAQFNATLGLPERSVPVTARASACYGLAAAYANKGEFAAALRWADESVRLAPGYPPARELQTRLRQIH
ncbi:MAG: tetratricopeptide repeat protein [Bacteroidota bacterium]